MIPVPQNDERIKIFRTMRNRIGEDGEYFIADGEKVVERLLNSGLEIKMIYGLKKYIDKFRQKGILENISENQLFYSSKLIMQKIIGYKIHQGIMALAVKPKPVQPGQLGKKILVLNSVLSAENTGAIVRSAMAFNVDSFLLDEKSCHPYIRRSVRVSLGSVFSSRISITNNLANSLLNLKKDGYRIVGSSSNGHKTIPVINSMNYRFEDKSALIFGNEGTGIQTDILEICDDILQIPVNDAVSSLNVASAATAILYQLNLN